jgi:hypothetical protein
MTAFREIIASDEEARFERYAAELRALQKARGGRERALHAKQHAGAVGRLEVGELPANLRVAVFAQPKTWPLYVRFSNGSMLRQRDRVPDVRAIALKLLGVPGRKLIRGLDDKKTQDFLFIQTMKDFKSGKRKDPIRMTAIAQATPDEDVAAAA